MPAGHKLDLKTKSWCPRMTMFGPDTPGSVEPPLSAASDLMQWTSNAHVIRIYRFFSSCHVRCVQKSTGISVLDPTSTSVARFSIFGCPDTPRMYLPVWVPHEPLG